MDHGRLGQSLCRRDTANVYVSRDSNLNFEATCTKTRLKMNHVNVLLPRRVATWVVKCTRARGTSSLRENKTVFDEITDENAKEAVAAAHHGGNEDLNDVSSCARVCC